VSNKKLKWRCSECGETFESEASRHSLDRCPEPCGEAWVDHEHEYLRRNALAKEMDNDG
jgi:predicted  nucleic acid-binding Zn-ribbon protein